MAAIKCIYFTAAAIDKRGVSMKTERLLAMVIYLLNHGTVSAAKLAEQFEVSKRTILRDMAHISMAGIPITSFPGANGGFSIMEGYKIDGRWVSAEDQSLIITALKGFLSAYGKERYGQVLEKVSAVLPKQTIRPIFLDFGASGENSETQMKIKAFEKAMDQKKTVEIMYVNAQGGQSIRWVEPVALNYRWYAWYLLAFCQTKQAYRIFKLLRISAFEPTDKGFTREHGDPAVLLAEAFQDSNRKAIDFKLLCKAEVKVPICEYLCGTITETFDNGDFILQLHTFEDERMWFAMLLSFGDKVTVLEPKGLARRVKETAENITRLYSNGDI